MVATITLNEDDFLTHSLYVTSKSRRIKANHIKSWLIISGTFLLLGAVFIEINNLFLAYYFLILAGVSLVFYPFYQRYRFKKHLKKAVLEACAKKIGIECVIDIQPDHINLRDALSTTDLNTSAIDEVIEISSHYFIKTSIGESLIIPKKMIDEHMFLLEVNAILQKKNLVIKKELDWKWK